MNLRAKNFVQTPIVALLLIWLSYLIILGLLQLCGFSFGFMVWPMGEDRNWLGFMMDGPGVQMTHEFWKIEDRNPLSPWWWLSASPIINAADCGIYIVRKLIDPFLAIITFLLLDRLGRQKMRTFAFCVALLVLMWNFSAYFEQIMWNFLGALGFSLLAIFFYCRYLDEKREHPRDLAIAMLCYLIAIATYTLQSGAIIAIALLGLFRGLPEQEEIK
jgi:hypothetical protein